MLDWNAIDTVLLDMDGTLLDLNFDNYFWREHVPQRYAELNHIPLQAAKHELFPMFHSVEGTMQWYCVDYWTETLGLDIAQLKGEIDHLIAVHPHVIEFLDRVRALRKRVILVTNAHFKSLTLKMERTELEGHFDNIICSHEFGMPKEQDGFWERLNAHIPFDAKRALLVDDSLPVLRAARAYGIAHLLAVRQPDSKGPPKASEEFAALHSFNDIMPAVPT